MNNLKRDNYRSAELEWLGDVPDGWGVKKIKYIFDVLNGATPKSGVDEYWDGNISWVTPDDLGNNDNMWLQDTMRKITQDGYDSCGTRIVPANSLALSIRAPIGHLAIVSMEFCVNQGCRALVLKAGQDSKYYYYFLLAANQELKSFGQGSTFQELGREKLRRVFLLNPPLSEQHSIANFLDEKTTKIDALIEKKQRLIELLKEKRTALISQAVTKGLDPNAKMKNSGVEWLGDVPAEWDIRKLKFIVKLKSGESITSEEIEEVDEYPVFGGNGLRGYYSKYTHDGHFVLIGRQGALCGNINYGKGKFWASEHAVVATPCEKMETIWLGELLQVMNLNQYSVSAAQPGLAVDKIKELLCPYPPFIEQKLIAEFIENETAEIDALIEKVQIAIDKLKEYRTALISAAVTGKIDVTEKGAI